MDFLSSEEDLGSASISVDSLSYVWLLLREEGDGDDFSFFLSGGGDFFFTKLLLGELGGAFILP